VLTVNVIAFTEDVIAFTVDVIAFIVDVIAFTVECYRAYCGMSSRLLWSHRTYCGVPVLYTGRTVPKG
jgi:hypothetical protein